MTAKPPGGSWRAGVMLLLLLLPLTSSPLGGRGLRRGTRKGRQRSKGQGCQEICHPGRPPPKVLHLEVGGDSEVGAVRRGGVGVGTVGDPELKLGKSLK